MNAREPSDGKFRELVVFLCNRSEEDRPFEPAKLNKLLFYSDFLAYMRLGCAITWQPYRKLAPGPCARRMQQVLRELEQSNSVAPTTGDYFGRAQDRTVALRPADLSEFTADEIALVEGIVQDCWGKSSEEMGFMSRGFLGWELAAEDEDIPYETALVQPAKTRDRVPADEERLAALLPALKEAAGEFRGTRD